MWEDAIENDGFAIFPGVFETEEIERLLEAISAASPRRSRAGVRHALRLSAVAELAQQSSLIETARAVLGPAAFPYRATLFDKSPKSNWLVV
ncbi:MAG: hypothetical protein WBQ85_08080, partial [Candidatus Sulfotelmatobacter sp.]